jgi:hypothetical protein
LRNKKKQKCIVVVVVVVLIIYAFERQRFEKARRRQKDNICSRQSFYLLSMDQFQQRLKLDNIKLFSGPKVPFKSRLILNSHVSTIVKLGYK